jgi:glutamine amidotransferase
MGLSFAHPIAADFTIREFGRHGEENADGWGLAWYPDRSLALVKEPMRWQASQYTVFLESYHGLRAPLYIAHVRHKTVGGYPTHADTQPFRRELNGQEYCFAHNGTLARFATLPLGRYRPVGATDSEHLFCHLLDAIRKRDRALERADDWHWLHTTLTALNDMGTLNCLFSDSQRLFCYHDATGHKGLALRPVGVSYHETRHFEDEELCIDLDGRSANHGFVIATRPLSAKGWQAFQRTELLVLERGMLRFSSHRNPLTLASSSPAEIT